MGLPALFRNGLLPQAAGHLLFTLPFLIHGQTLARRQKFVGKSAWPPRGIHIMLQAFAGRGQILVPVLQKMGQIPVERFPVLGRVGENFGQDDGVDRADLGTKTTVHAAQCIHIVSISIFLIVFF